MLNLVDSAVATLRQKHKQGEMYYKILYYNFFSERELRSQEEILGALADDGYPMWRKTMLDNRALAVNLVSTFLWGYTEKETLEILDKFAGK